jgi:3-carboxy-cis,cis-muconate cycloisomerase
MSYSVFDHPILSGLVGNDEVAVCFSTDADIRAMLEFEAALARVEGRLGVIPPAAGLRIAEVCASFRPDIFRLKEAVGRDGVVIPDLVRQLRQAVGGDEAQHVHFGATSQDAIDTSLMLRLKKATGILSAQTSAAIAGLDRLRDMFGSNRLMGFTRMQAAIPITAADRIQSWREPLARSLARLDTFALDGFVLQFGGAAGTLEKFPEKRDAVRAALAKDLGLADRPQWHSQRDRLVEFASLLSLLAGLLGKFGQDVALLAERADEIRLSGGGGSSAMPHKQNPVAAETLVALARFNAVQVSGLHHSLVHEQERSGAAWTLEWMLLPQMVGATAASLTLATALTERIEMLGTAD